MIISLLSRQKSRKSTTLQQKDVKKEELGKEEDKNGVKEEELSGINVQSEDGVDNYTEQPSRK